MFQGLPNPGFRSVKVQTETFLKKDSRDFKNSFCLGFLQIPSKPGKQNWNVPFFGVFIIVKKHCVPPVPRCDNKIDRNDELLRLRS